MFTIGPDLLNFLCVVMLRYHLKKQRKKDWLSPTSESFKTLQDIVFSNSILKDLSYLTKFAHTGTMKFITPFTTDGFQKAFISHFMA